MFECKFGLFTANFLLIRWGWGGWLVGLNDNKANSVKVELELGLSLEKFELHVYKINLHYNCFAPFVP